MNEIELPFAFALQDCRSGSIAVPVPFPLIYKPIIYLLQLQACFLYQFRLILLLKIHTLAKVILKAHPLAKQFHR